MGIIGNMIKDLTKKRPKFKLGEKVKCKLHKGTYVVVAFKEVYLDGQYEYKVTDGKKEIKYLEVLLESAEKPKELQIGGSW